MKAYLDHGVQGTPTFYINGQRHDGDDDLGSMIETINSRTKMKSGMYVLTLRDHGHKLDT